MKPPVATFQSLDCPTVACGIKAKFLVATLPIPGAAEMTVRVRSRRARARVTLGIARRKVTLSCDFASAHVPKERIQLVALDKCWIRRRKENARQQKQQNAPAGQRPLQTN